MGAIEKLRDIERALKNGESQEASPREILGWFKYERRGFRVVDHIDRKMRRIGIKTTPHMNDVYIDRKVAFSLLPPPPPPPPAPAPPPPPAKCKTTVRIAPHVGLLAAANRPPLSVAPDATIRAAVSLMMVNDYSQLPILSGGRAVRGLFSWKSYGTSISLGTNPATVIEAAQTDVTVIDEAADLIEAIPAIVRHEVALVRARDNSIRGIITTTDLSLEFRSLTEPFILLGDVENHLRALLNDRFTLDELRASLDPRDDPARVNGLEDLNFSSYVAILSNEERWARLGVPLERSPLIKILNRVREIRNDVMHFSPDPVDDDSMTTLRNAKRVLTELRRAAGC